MRTYTWTRYDSNFFRAGVDAVNGTPVVAVVHGMHPDHPVFLTMKEIETIHGEMLARERRERASK